MNMWIATARLLYCFDFIEDPVHFCVNELTQENPIDTMTIPQLTGGRAPFHVNIKIRSPAHAELIRRDCYAATKEVY